MDEETIWNVLMRCARRGWGLAAECYGIAETQTIVCFQQTATSLSPWEVCKHD